MKVSVSWLQKYFTDPLPPVEEIVDALTYHSSEVEEIIGEGENTVLDVKVLPDRAPYALSHRGVAYELAAALGRPLETDPLREPLPDFPTHTKGAPTINISIEDQEKCPRYMAAFVTNVAVGPSPDWLQKALNTLGQRSINNVVDATNYVMLNIGQPLHAFDVEKLSKSDGNTFDITIRGSKTYESITTLTGEEYKLPEGTTVVTDAEKNNLLGVAGVKGGKAAEITLETQDIIIEAANFDGTSIRRASQALKLWTDASLRYQNKISPELAAYGMRDVLALISEIAGGEIISVVDSYPNPEVPAQHVSVTVEQINIILGASFSAEEITGALDRLGLEYVLEGETIILKPSFERRDLVLWQDVAEEVGRVLGYDQVEAAELPAMKEAPDQNRFKGIERIKDILMDRGFTEISTQSFATVGEITLENPLQSEKPWLRAGLFQNMQEALTRASQVAPRVLGPVPHVKLFELGTVFTQDGEFLSLCLGCEPFTKKLVSDTVQALVDEFPEAKIPPVLFSDASIVEISFREVDLELIGTGYEPARIELGTYTPFSLYPSLIRDIAVWTPERTEESQVALLIQKDAGDLLARMDLFDRFEKEGRVSYAFRLIFQSGERTLSDTDVDPIMMQITNTLNANEGWQVR